MKMAFARNVTLTGDPYVDGMFIGTEWATPLTFSFPSEPSFYGPPGTYSAGEQWNNFEAFTPFQQAAVRSILQSVASVTNLTLTEVTESLSVHGDLRYAETDQIDGGIAYYPSDYAPGGDSWYHHS